MEPATRTEEDVRLVVVGLGQTVSSFTGIFFQGKKIMKILFEFISEFPLQRQYALARIAILEEFERGRVILREGHRAEKFYLIVDGVSKFPLLFSKSITHCLVLPS